MNLQQRREELSLNKKQFCKLVGSKLHYSTYVEIENGTRSPLKHVHVQGKTIPDGWNQYATTLAEFYGVTEDDLFPTCAFEVSTDPDELVDLVDADKQYSSPLVYCIYEYLQQRVRETLSSLTPREEKVLRMRFGIGESIASTLEEVAINFGVTRSRIMQIEAKALNKLRHPTRSRMLFEFVTDDALDRPLPYYCMQCGETRPKKSAYCKGDHCWVSIPRDKLSYWYKQHLDEWRAKRFRWLKNCLGALEVRDLVPWQNLPRWCPDILPEGILEEYQAYLEEIERKQAEWRAAQERRKEKQKQLDQERKEAQTARAEFSEEFIVVNPDNEVVLTTMVSKKWLAAMDDNYISMDLLGKRVTMEPNLRKKRIGI